MDIQGPDLHGDPLGVVRREDPHGPLLPRPKGRRGNGDPRADTRDVVPGLPQNVEDLDSRAHQRPGGRLSPTHADRPCRPVQSLWISGLRRGRQPSRIAPHRVQRRAIFARQGARAVEIETAAQATPPCAFASSPRPSRPREEDQQPANVADGDVSRRDRIALGLGRRTAASATTCDK